MNGLLNDLQLDSETPAPSGANLTVTPAPFARLDATAVVAVEPVARSATETPPHARLMTLGTGGRPARFPAVGETFLGFQLVELLGTGAFAHVYLAHQAELSGRSVALKVTTRPSPEPQRLARLRHTNVVPIHSVHDRPPLQAVCMPYLGRNTLADVLEEYRRRGVFPRTSAHLVSTAALVGTTQVSVRSTAPAGAPVPVTVPFVPSASSPLPTQVELVLWVLARLADGLSHAHDRGILHLDLKPANVLLADDGQPLLLDFNLSYDVRSDDRPRTGGTLPYMAPEQLEEYRDGGVTRVDQRTDLFALGVIAYELLTGRKPFPVEPDRRRDLTEMVKVRKAGPARVRPFNPAVSPAVEAVVLKLLHPDPDGRYQSARDLAEDLDRHRQDLPLRYAADRSVVERAAKWRRRNPKAPLLAALAVLALAAGGSGFAAYRHAESGRLMAEDRARADAVVRAQDVRRELAALRVDLTSRDYAKKRATARDRGRLLLAWYGVPARADWTGSDARDRLAPEAWAALTDDLGELALLMAHSHWLDGRGMTSDVQARFAEEALTWNGVADTCFIGRTAPAAVAHQRARLAAAAGRPEAESASAGDTDIDLYLVGSELIAEGRFADATKKFEVLTSHDPAHYGGQFALGVCRQETGDVARAQERYLVAQSLMPSDYRPAYNRGVMLRQLGKMTEAAAVFSEAIERDNTCPLSYQYRASARLNLRDYPGAIADLTAMIENGGSELQARYARAVTHELAGDPESAAKDRAVADALTPSEPFDFLSRGYSRRKKDPALALADYEKAAELDPNCLTAWQNQAAILADTLRDPGRALAAQEKAVAAAPEFARARSGRAVLYARSGRRADAHKDAEYALLLSGDPWVTYEAACVYALTAATHPGDWKAAEGLFRQALRDGFRDFKHIEDDADLTDALKRPAFRDALAAAKVLGKNR